MPELPEGEVTDIRAELLRDNRTGGLVELKVAEVVFPNGSRVFRPVRLFLNPHEVQLNCHVRWTDRFGGDLIAYPATPSQRPADGTLPTDKEETPF